MKLYKTPIDFIRIFESDYRGLEQCSEKESIDHHIELIMTTAPGEHKFDSEFGCKIWELDFEKVVSKSRWENLYIKYITEAVKKYEPRVTDIETKVFLSDAKIENKFSNSISIRNKIDIRIDLTIISTKVRCCYYYTLYLGPLSSD